MPLGFRWPPAWPDLQTQRSTSTPESRHAPPNAHSTPRPLLEEVADLADAAMARLLAGRALAQAGEPDRAAAELERAAPAFDSFGASRYRAEAERELRKLGRHIHRRTQPGKPTRAGRFAHRARARGRPARSSTARPTPRSRPRCSSARRPSRRTSATCSASSASPHASSSRVPSSEPMLRRSSRRLFPGSGCGPLRTVGS